MNIKRIKEYAINSYIYNTYYHKKIDENLVYVESRDGNDFAGNILRIVEELSTGKYGSFRIVVYAKDNVHKKIKELQKNYSLKIDEITSKESSATKTMEKAKYIITDSGLRPKYVKRPGQIVLNTWHGTPLKTMGVDNIAEQYRIGNIQQVFFSCDYLLYPNEYIMEKMLNSYMVEKIYPGKIIFEGYPRNSVFFDEKRADELKNTLNLKDKEVIAYMPTFKGLMLKRKDDTQKSDVERYLSKIDESLNENQILLVKLHVFNQKQIDFSRFRHVRAFPQGFETYDILNICDCLITDYSSVFFDYANTKNKIILFNYDEAEYMKDRGTYFPLSDLPFPRVQNVNDLINEINSPKVYDDSEFLNQYCPFENLNATEHLCELVFNGKNACMIKKYENRKENVLIKMDDVDDDKISRLLKEISGLNTDDKNYFISYPTWNEYIKQNYSDLFDNVPDDVEFAPIRSPINPTLSEELILKIKPKSKLLNNLYEREQKRSFNELIFNIFDFN
ncbi:CDP-glycerol glycerophosphotransferase family protein [Methanobrevibacter sp.]|uniref:CDP-glycerol glycerophosphotransferase family protein n=1 Tax=Methanobrevibacter sp. TaxID=66852 RepID=UPI003890D9DC